MKLHRVRPICRAPNCFSPSLVLLQHFMLPHDVLRLQRFSSSVHASATVDIVAAPKPPEISASVAPSAPTQIADIAPSPNHDRPVAPRFVFGPQDQDATDPSAAPMSKEELRGLEKRLIKMQKRVKASDSSDRLYQAKLKSYFVESAMHMAKAAANICEHYTALVIPPVPARRSVPESAFPWASQTPYKTSEPMDRLDQEIHAFWDYIKPDKAEISARRALIDQVRAHVRQRLPDHELEVFGSERTGMAFALSDIDFRLIRPDDSKEGPSAILSANEQRRRTLKDLWTLRYNVFSNKAEPGRHYKRPEVRGARYPLLTVKDRNSGLDIQIVLSKNTASAREYMQRYMSEYPYLRQLHAVVKTMFDQRGLTNVYRGGFGSYAIFMMIVASLQRHTNQRKDAAGALLNFLYYWAYFDTRACGVSVSPLGYFDKNEHPVLTDRARAQIADGTYQHRPDWLLCLRDPADETNDLGRAGTCILHLQATLRELVVEVISGLNSNKRPSLLAPLIGDIYAHQHEHRVKLREYGLRIQPEMGPNPSVDASNQQVGKQEQGDGSDG